MNSQSTALKQTPIETAGATTARWRIGDAFDSGLHFPPTDEVINTMFELADARAARAYRLGLDLV